MIELLAGAGNKESFITAIKNGANAIYLGTKKFNARGKIDNFSFEELSSLVSYAHLYNVKVYLTLNTLIYDDEINEILEIVYNANKVKIDAFIVQDLGLAHLLKKIYPSIELHASTQMGIHNLEGAIVAEKMGFKRIVLARETPLKEIKRIKQNTNLEIEYFIQGALCVCFSGNCYLSSKLYNESGNRGRCLQPCRLPLTLKDGSKVISTKYHLSSKDFCMARRLKDLIDAGVTSLKIEGRARRSGYVARVVSVYRRLLDGEDFDKKKQDSLKLAFNRGDYCEGYFNGNSGIIDSNIQNNIGLKIGKVVDFKKGNKFNIIVISSNREIGKNDVLKFVREKREVASIVAVDIKQVNGLYHITTTNEVRVNDEVSMLIDYDEENQIINTDKKRYITALFVARQNEKAKLTFKDEESGLSVECESDSLTQVAKNSPLSKEDISKAVCKMANDIFKVLSIKIVADNIFMAKSELNELRRKTTQLLITTLLKDYEEKNNLKTFVPYNFIDENINKYNLNEGKRKIIIQINSLSQLNEEIIKKVDYIIYKAKEWTESEFKNLNKYIIKNNLKQKILIYIPPFLTSEDYKGVLKLISVLGKVRLYINNIGGLSFSFEGYEVVCGGLMNIASKYSALFLQRYNVSEVVLSYEMGVDKANEVNSKLAEECFYISYGSLPYMTLKHCPFKENFNCTCSNCSYKENLTLTNSNSNTFKFVRDKIVNCSFELVTTKVEDRLNEIKNYPRLNLLLIFDGESEREILSIIKNL